MKDYCGSIVNRIQLLPLGTFPGETLIDLSAGLRKRFGVACEVLAAESEPAFAFNFARQQYSSTGILASLNEVRCPQQRSHSRGCDPDEAPLRGSCAVVSFHRLRQEFYGLPADSTVLRERPLKEAVHELGEDYQCVMSPAHGVDSVDLKTRPFCTSCRVTVTSRSAGVARG
jgi:archaemetzincin